MYLLLPDGVLTAVVFSTALSFWVTWVYDVAFGAVSISDIETFYESTAGKRTRDRRVERWKPSWID